jgi:predicted glycoside hydrolase/deacetylase ChbG (UPF0249 family)
MAADHGLARARCDVQPPLTGVRQRLVLCADDYALTPGVSEGILVLAQAGRLSAVSCMTASPFWPEHAAALQALEGRIDIGLHLTLTDQRPLGPMPRTAPSGRLPGLARLFRLGVAGRLARDEIAAEIERQVAAFEAGLGRPPDFIDGHQHAHVLPGVRGPAVAAAASIAGRRPVWLRSCVEPTATILRRGVAVRKALLISGLSAGLAKAALRLGVPTNRGFGGVLDYRRGPPLAACMPRLLCGLGPRPLVMCHPGRPDAILAAADPLVEPRSGELDYLLGPDFAADLAQAGVHLARWREVA